jgi:glutaminyl-peptide cyclotransferase
MKKIRKYQVIPGILNWIFISILFIGGCTESEGQKEEIQSSPRIRKGVSIVQPESGASFILGDQISFQLEHKDNLPIDSVKLEIFETSITNIGNQIEWEASYTGSPDIKIFAYYGERVEAVFPNVKILSDKEPQQLTYRIVNQYPHDESAYTQGLYFYNGQLIESTGQRGSSTIRITNYKTGEIDKIKNLESKYFGEGATVYKDQIYQLT